MTTWLLSLVLSASATSGQGQSLEIFGYIGQLGEWELTASVRGRTDELRSKDLSGPLMLRHVGICTQDGPQEKTGQIHLHLSASSSELKATMLIDGVECSYRGRQSDSYFGLLKCPDRRPVPLTLWAK